MSIYSKKLHYFQDEADNAIYNDLVINDNNECIVKMFCGTGKSLLMRRCKINNDKNLLVYVFPSLPLIEQFDSDYLLDSDLNTYQQTKIRICSDNDELSTTHIPSIVQFLKLKNKKFVLVTYQSFDTLLEALKLSNSSVDVCHFDEAHHVVGNSFQELIFKNNYHFINKKIFYTATPRNLNGIVMYDCGEPDKNMCGNLVYDFNYYRGMTEDYLNSFDINIDLYLDNSTNSIYKSIARAAIITGNNRILTFHSDVNGDSDTSVLNFVDQDKFVNVYNDVCNTEFNGQKKFSHITMIAFHTGFINKCNFCINACKNKIHRTNNDRCCRFNILNSFDDTYKKDNELFIIASCRTISEGVDTKNANMIAFVDPKSSKIDILQNIGRIIRKLFGQLKRKATILLPCWVDREKYKDAQESPEKRDEIIRSNLNQGGDFNAILNVLSALRQEDEQLYEMCLQYNETISPQELSENLSRQHFRLDNNIGDLEDVLEKELELQESINLDEFVSEDYLLNQLALEHNTIIEIHSDTFDTPVEIYSNSNMTNEPKSTIKLLRNYNKETDETSYQSIVHVNGSRKSNDIIVPPERKKERMRINYYTNDSDIQVLWKINSNSMMDLSNTITNCIIDCEVIQYDPMERASDIVNRAQQRFENGGNLLPRKIRKSNRTNEEKQEYKDATKLANWKQALKGSKNSKCSNEVKEYLDSELIGWRDELDAKAMEDAVNLVDRAKLRFENGGNLLPRNITKSNQTNEEKQETKDAQKLGKWKQSLKGKGKSNCSNEVKEYLDGKLIGWRDERDAKAMEDAANLVDRAQQRFENGGKLLPREISKKNRTNEEKQEYKDAIKLGKWKQSLKGNGKYNCSNEVKEYLDGKLIGWRDELDLDAKAMEYAVNLVDRAKLRFENGGNLLPREIRKTNKTNEEKQEYKDAQKLGSWKKALKGKGNSNCSNEVKEYLDSELIGWRDEKRIAPKKKSMKLQTVVQSEDKCEEQKEGQIEKRECVKSKMSILQREYNVLRSDNLHQLFNEVPQLWYEYHGISEENEKSFPSEAIPRNQIIMELEKIKTKRTKKVVDMGCGPAHIARHFKNTQDTRFSITNYDHYASNEMVERCDISQLPLEDDSVEICILSLAMMGSNNKEYIQEAHRVLETNGILYIAEPTKRWSEKNERGIVIEGKEACELISELEKNFDIKSRKVTKFALFVCVNK